MLAGSAHGAAGIGCALARLSAATGHEPFLEGARLAFRYEESIFDPQKKNWPILARNRQSDTIERIEATTWCHGAPGVALARLAALQVLDDDTVRNDLETALETTLSTSLSRLDHLCCGNLGVADVLLTAGQYLHRDTLIRGAEARTAFVLRRATGTGRFSLRLDESENRSFTPGLFRGSSGIGYQLLRVARPLLLPSVLAFEASGRTAGGA